MTTGFTPPGSDAFTRLMQQAWEQWQSGLGAQGAAMNDAGEENIERAFAGLKHYFGLLESMQSRLGETLDPDQWRGALDGIFGAGLPFTSAFADASQLAGGGPQAWMQSWQKMLGTSSLGGWRDMLAMPGIGFAREHQERGQQLIRDVLGYQEQMQRYNQLLARAGKLGAERFEARLAERMEPGRQIESLRALYDLWVDAAEEGFQEVALSPEWAEVYGALVDAQMRVRAGVQRQVEQASREMGMPTRSEIETLGKRLHDLRRQVRALEARLAASEPDAARQPAAGDAGSIKRAGSAKATNTPRKPASKVAAKTRSAGPSKSSKRS